MSTSDDAYARLRAQTASTTRSATREEAVRRGPERARRLALRLLDDGLARLPPGRPRWDCEAGCAMCCHLRVAATAAEVFGLLDYLARTLDGDQLDALRQRVEATAGRVHGLQPGQRLTTNIACPVLVDGCCSGYAGRPLNCRAYHSLDVDACRASFDRPEDMALGHLQDAAVARVNEGVQRGFIDALGETGLDGTQYELATALAEAIADPGRRAEFLAGRVAFVQAIRL